MRTGLTTRQLTAFLARPAFRALEGVARQLGVQLPAQAEPTPGEAEAAETAPSTRASLAPGVSREGVEGPGGGAGSATGGTAPLAPSVPGRDVPSARTGTPVASSSRSPAPVAATADDVRPRTGALEAQAGNAVRPGPAAPAAPAEGAIHFGVTSPTPGWDEGARSAAPLPVTATAPVRSGAPGILPGGAPRQPPAPEDTRAQIPSETVEPAPLMEGASDPALPVAPRGGPEPRRGTRAPGEARHVVRLRSPPYIGIGHEVPGTGVAAPRGTAPARLPASQVPASPPAPAVSETGRAWGPSEAETALTPLPAALHDGAPSATPPVAPREEPAAPAPVRRVVRLLPPATPPGAPRPTASTPADAPHAARPEASAPGATSPSRARPRLTFTSEPPASAPHAEVVAQAPAPQRDAATARLGEQVTRGMTPVWEQAHQLTQPALSVARTSPLPPPPGTPAPPQGAAVRNTFNVNVHVDPGNAQPGLDRRSLEDALVDILRETARRHGLEV